MQRAELAAESTHDIRAMFSDCFISPLTSAAHLRFLRRQRGLCPELSLRADGKRVSFAYNEGKDLEIPVVDIDFQAMEFKRGFQNIRGAREDRLRDTFGAKATPGDVLLVRQLTHARCLTV